MSEGKYSKAVAKLASVIAVLGTGLKSEPTGLTILRLAGSISNGLRTSLATLMTTSNREASSAVGSRYKYTLSS